MRDFSSGVRLLARGFGYWARRPKVMLWGAIPAVISTILIGAGLITLLVEIDDLSGWMTGFADGWPSGWRTLVQVLAGIVVIGLAVWVAIVAFTALTLIIGDPFYERISQEVDAELGGVDTVEPGFWASLRQGIVDGIRLAVKSAIFGVFLFLIGLIPGIGSVVSLVLGAFVGGWFLTVELAGFGYTRRGVRYREYRKLLAKRRAMALGFGTPVFLLFLIPLGAILVMPAAVAGGTLLVRHLEGTPTSPQPPVNPLPNRY